MEGAETLQKRLLGRRGRKVRVAIARDCAGRERRIVAVQPAASGPAGTLRCRRWVRGNARYVERKSRGRLGYVHIRNMGPAALEDFRLDLTPALRRREGVIIDIRYNGGSFVAPFVIDTLLQRAAMRVSLRGRAETSAANLAGASILDRPTILLRNEQSLSNAEMFSEAYRRLGLGRIVGTSTCGRVVWTWGRRLVDGTYLRLPRIAVRTLEGRDLETKSRRPDIFVDRSLGEAREGIDSQLDRAIEELLKEIDARPARF